MPALTNLVFFFVFAVVVFAGCSRQTTDTTPTDDALMQEETLQDDTLSDDEFMMEETIDQGDVVDEMEATPEDGTVMENDAVIDAE